MSDTATSATPREGFKRLAQALASPQADTGHVATLRRFHPQSERSRCIFASTQALSAAGVSIGDDDQFQRWSLVVHCLAIVKGATDERVPAGAVLARFYQGDARMRQLLAADAHQLFDLLPTLARRAAASRETLDWWPLAKLALYAGRDEPLADQARGWLASDFVRTRLHDPANASATPDTVSDSQREP